MSENRPASAEQQQPANVQVKSYRGHIALACCVSACWFLNGIVFGLVAFILASWYSFRTRWLLAISVSVFGRQSMKFIKCPVLSVIYSVFSMQGISRNPGWIFMKSTESFIIRYIFDGLWKLLIFLLIFYLNAKNRNMGPEAIWQLVSEAVRSPQGDCGRNQIQTHFWIETLKI